MFFEEASKARKLHPDVGGSSIEKRTMRTSKLWTTSDLQIYAHRIHALRNEKEIHK
jgi:hypothetical protein